MAKDGLRSCPCFGCDQVVRPGQLMCRDHWRRVPRGLRLEVNGAWSWYRQVCRKGGDDWQDAMTRYRLASAAAIRVFEPDAKAER